MEAARATVRATADQRRAVLLTALAEVARDYIDLRGTQEQLRIARENLRTANQSLQLTQEQAAAGVTTDLDVANASAQVSITAAQIPALQQRERQEINALSLLLGRPPGALEVELAVPRPVPPVPPEVPVGFPSELVRRRPDILQAEATLHAATATVGVAVASFYPSVTLSASFGFQALTFGNLWKWDARQYDAGPGFTIPIFQGGELKYTLHSRKAQQQEAAIAYVKTVLSALARCGERAHRLPGRAVAARAVDQCGDGEPPRAGAGAEPLPRGRGRLPHRARYRTQPAVGGAATGGEHHHGLHQSGGAVQGAGRRLAGQLPGGRAGQPDGGDYSASVSGGTNDRQRAVNGGCTA